ncbi:amino acid ABC transporter permease [Desulfoluna butyratoxydans]|uniref:Amino acid abc transporter permease protein 3-tm domain n=1 Tax=Desulfoluna butyratoxydans TaxID=231438 RepID=A0A4U8YHW5_9BACT|nr:amino acid ABC transporter permease [Desulfoluna butyratoxydans]VFQ42784.1 amino acid abc transporter permease protein 3-tm domain [Desulfoluna butyratoxydans]
MIGFGKKRYRFGMVDAAALLLVGALVLWFFHRVGAVLDYGWEWGAVPSYILRRTDEGGWVPNLLLTGFFTTVKLSLWASLLASVIGIPAGAMRAQGSPGQKLLGWVYVETIRNIPSLVLVFLFYFFISSQFLDLLGVDAWLRGRSEITRAIFSFLFAGEAQINAFLSAVITLAIYEGAYVTEIVRGGLLAVPFGQKEAARATGLKERQVFRYVILPQALRKIISPLAGQFISTIKDSAIMSVISIQELTFQGMEVMAATFLTFEVWLTVTFLYLILTFSLSQAAAFMDRRIAKY